MKKIICLALAALLGIGTVCLSACGGSGGEGEKDLSSIGYQYADVTKPIVNEPDAIGFQIMAPKNPLALEYKDMQMFKDLYAQTNVKIEWDNITYSSYAAQKNNMWSDPDSLPDAIYGAGYGNKELIKNSRNGNIIPLNDFIDSGKMPYFKAILDKDPELRKVLTQEDGKIYSLPRVEKMGLKKYSQLLFINKNWVQDAIDAGVFRLEEGETLVKPGQEDWTKNSPDAGFELDIAEFESLLGYFKGYKNDAIPLTFVLQNWQGNQSDLYGMFGCVENIDHKLIHNGKVEITAVTDSWKEGTKKIGEWISKGYINKEVLENKSWNEAKFLTIGRSNSERYGAFYWWDSEEVVANPENYVCLNPIINGANQYVGVSNQPEIEKGYFVITKNCQNPEVLATWIDRSYEGKMSAMINYGPVGIEFEEETDELGRLVFKPVPEGETESDRRLKNAPVGLCYLGEEQWQNDVKMEDRAVLRLERIENHAAPYVKEGYEPYPEVTFTRKEQNLINEIEKNIYDEIERRLFYWLEHPAAIDSEWESFKNVLYGSYRLDEYIQVHQDAYDRSRA